jgi:hypothetical protein
MNHRLEQAVVVRYDPDQAPAIAYHREHGMLVVTFGPEPSGVDHVAVILRREVDPEIRAEVASAYDRGYAEGVEAARAQRGIK